MGMGNRHGRRSDLDIRLRHDGALATGDRRRCRRCSGDGGRAVPEPSFPAAVREQAGTGIAGNVDGHRVAVGQLAFVAPNAPRTPELRSIELRTAVEASSGVYVSIDGSLAGVLLLQDPIRPEVPRALRSLRAAGVRRIHMVTGDHPDVAELVGDALGVDRVFAERTPEEEPVTVVSALALALIVAGTILLQMDGR